LNADVALAWAVLQKVLGNGERAGFFIGDGAGVGKGRELAGIVLENWAAGRRRAVWVSVSVDLKFDAQRDLTDLGFGNIPVHSLHKLGYKAIAAQDGVMFCSYTALAARATDRSRRLDQLIAWCGPDFEGCLFFDEW
jgi:hypothetical protein